MSAMKSDLAESLADFKAAIARNEAAAARESAERKQENEKLRTEIEKSSKWQTTVILGGFAVAVTILGLWLQPGG